MNSPNQDLLALYKILVKTHDGLHDLRSRTSDPKLAGAMLTELREITHHIDLVQSQLFTRHSNIIARGVEKIEAANAELKSALKDISRATDLAKACTSSLTAVNRVIDLAKTAA